MFKDMMETTASLFDVTVLERKKESSCAEFLVNTLRSHFQKHLPWTRSRAAHQHGDDALPCRKTGSVVALLHVRGGRRADLGGNSHRVP